MADRDDLEAAKELLDAHPDYRVLRRLSPPSEWELRPGEGQTRRALFVDVETTGLDVETDEVIEVALLPFDYDPQSGHIVSVLLEDALDQLRDPGISIPPESIDIHGITDAMVAGKAVDSERLTALVKSSHLVISHNAAFDRPMAERLWNVFEDVPWACSLTDVDWRGEGFPSGGLELLLLGMGWFYDGHRALNDCLAAVFALAQELPDSGRPAMALLLESARRELSMLRATGSPFDAKDLLKKRGYRWDPGTNEREKAWWTLTENPEDELAWLHSEIYGYDAPVPSRTVDAKTRFSRRIWS